MTKIRWAMMAAGLALLLSATTGTAMAGAKPPTPVPEIDPGSILSAMTLLGGGLMMLTDRRRPK